MKLITLLDLLKFFTLINTLLRQIAANEDEFEKFKEYYNKEYPTIQEEQKAKQNFIDNLNFIAEHNEKYEKGLVTFKVGVNHLADKSINDFKFMYNTYRRLDKKSSINTLSVNKFSKSCKKAIDWRRKGAVTPVKDQGECGSCWSFSTTGALEGQHFIKTGELISLSEQNLIDCITENKGCNGGNPSLAFDWIHENDGINSEKSYPYEMKKGECRFDSFSTVTSCNGYVELPENNETALEFAIANIGPISIGIEASQREFQLYSSGIYYNEKCGGEPDHAVLCVGFGSENGKDYWIVKNSWSKNWGEKGYIKMARNRNNNCCISCYGSYPV